MAVHYSILLRVASAATTQLLPTLFGNHGGLPRAVILILLLGTLTLSRYWGLCFC